MTPTEINKKIARWLGHTCGEIHIIKDGFIIGLIPCYYTTNAAFDLLDVLVERGYCPSLSYHSETWFCYYDMNQKCMCIKSKSKSAAICEAIIVLLEKEKP